MNQVLFVDRSEPSDHLACYVESQFDLQPAATTDEVLQGFSIDELHRIKVVPAAFSEVMDRGDTRMVDAGCGPRFPQETAPGSFVTDELRANDLQSHRATEVGIDGLVGYPHASMPQL